jgi:hypothetical protein
MRTNIDAAITYLKKVILHRNQNTQTVPSTFTSTHPSKQRRIEHFENLRSEVELQKARGQTRPQIDWDTIIERYKNSR